MHSNFINGEWLKGEGKTLKAISPSDFSCYFEGNQASLAEVKNALKAAKKSQISWSKKSLEYRIEIAQKFCDALSESKEEMAKAISLETGKPFWEAKTEVTAAISKLAISVKAYESRTPNHQSISNGITTRLAHKPLGVVVVLGPYNFPCHLPNGHIIPALIAGNSVLFKPSEETPYTAILMAKLWQQAGLPSGVLNLIQGDGEIGQALINEPVDAVLFTGSANTGVQIHKALAGRVEVLLALEMGGNNPLVAWDINNLDAAIYHIIQSAFITSGQRCTCARRLIVKAGEKGDKLLQALATKINHIVCDAPFAQTSPFMGPVINQKTVDSLLSFWQKLINDGARPLVNLSRMNREGAFLSPGLIDVTDIKIREDVELFGPLLQVIRVSNFNEAIIECNRTQYGLSAGLLSDNPELFVQFESEVKAGLVNFNRPLTGASSASPFGGVGLSGNHRPAAFYSADCCAYPMAGLSSDELTSPES